MSQLPKIWIVTPCYFDLPAFLDVREGARAALAGTASSGLSFLFIDDAAGSDPEVAAQLEGLADVSLIRPPYNLGHQGALVFGLRQAAPAIAPEDIVITMDSDGEDRPGDIPALVAPLLARPSRLDLIAIARRTHRTRSPVFHLGYFCFRILFRLATGTIVRSGNFVAFRGWLLRDIINHPHFDQCYSSTFISLPLNREMVPLPRGRRQLGRSKMGFWGLLTHGVRMLMPFTENIAIRGLFAWSLASTGFLLFFLGAWLGCHRPHRAALLLGFVGFLGSLILAVLHIVLFTTFSQAKSHSLRYLHSRYTS